MVELFGGRSFESVPAGFTRRNDQLPGRCLPTPAALCELFPKKEKALTPQTGLRHLGRCPIAVGHPAQLHPLCIDTAFSQRLLSRRFFRVAQIQEEASSVVQDVFYRQERQGRQGPISKIYPFQNILGALGVLGGSLFQLAFASSSIGSNCRITRLCVPLENKTSRHQTDYSAKPPSRYRVYSQARRHEPYEGMSSSCAATQATAFRPRTSPVTGIRRYLTSSSWEANPTPFLLGRQPSILG